MVTIATHNGSAAHRAHNIRDKRVVTKQEHIDPNGKFETWLDYEPRKAYDILFGQALDDYNQRQKRDDRKIANYFDHIQKDEKKHAVYEMIIGVYSDAAECNESLQRDILLKFVADWKNRNQNLVLIGAYYHADEQGQPHVHLDYVPIANGYKKGLKIQNGLVKALGQMGFTKNGRDTAQIQWQKRENKVLEDLCVERGLKVSHPKKEAVQHLDTQSFKAHKELDNTLQQDKLLREQLVLVQNDFTKKQKEYEKLKIQQKAIEKLVDKYQVELSNSDEFALDFLNQFWNYDIVSKKGKGIKQLGDLYVDYQRQILHKEYENQFYNEKQYDEELEL
jgi:hypothetical protein